MEEVGELNRDPAEDKVVDVETDRYAVKPLLKFGPVAESAAVILACGTELVDRRHARIWLWRVEEVSVRPLDCHIKLAAQALAEVMRSHVADCRAVQLGVSQEKRAYDAAIASRRQLGMLAVLGALDKPFERHEPLPNQCRAAANADVVVENANQKECVGVRSRQRDLLPKFMLYGTIASCDTLADSGRHLHAFAAITQGHLDPRLQLRKVKQATRRLDLESHNVRHGGAGRHRCSNLAV
mmetsp:Transcript_51945/g.134720  ORF Transcript_51945/g.134720 Transcript_51945/m.134720 type:complete len:240 (+) Transcript_51945:882-1601(+)